MRKTIDWPPKKHIFEFWNKNGKKISSYLSLVLTLKTIDAQMLFWSVFLKTHKKPLLIEKMAFLTVNNFFCAFLKIPTKRTFVLLLF